MKVQIRGDTLAITGLKELAAANYQSFRDQVRGALTGDQQNIEIDLSETMFIDSCGLGALISLHKTVCARQGQVRLLHPTPPVRQILELTRMHRIFEVVNIDDRSSFRYLVLALLDSHSLQPEACGRQC